MIDCRDVVEVGAGVTSRQVGERVALEPGVPCWSNRMSRSTLHALFVSDTSSVCALKSAAAAAASTTLPLHTVLFYNCNSVLQCSFLFAAMPGMHTPVTSFIVSGRWPTALMLMTDFSGEGNTCPACVSSSPTAGKASILMLINTAKRLHALIAYVCAIGAGKGGIT